MQSIGSRKDITSTRSPEGIPILIEKLHEHLKKKKMIFEDVIATVGVAGGLTLVFTALVNPGDEVLFPDPLFS